MTPPLSTYRVQLHRDFTFRDAAAIAPYLRDLGVTHLYCSPSLQSAPGSMHGYDVVDPTRLDDERGGDEGFAVLRDALREHGLGVVLDIVPNHLGLVLPENRWWWDVLRHGPDSRWADHFDIDWRRSPPRPRLVWPVLGAELADVLADGAIEATVADGELVLVYGDHRLPTRPGSTTDHGLPVEAAAAATALTDDPELLAEVVRDQHYELVHWQRGNQELVHRRFFDIVTLGGVRIEDQHVFDDVHGLVLALVADGPVDGLRVDHPDGLWDPAGYARSLRAAAPDCWIVFEKILEQGEEPRHDWPVDGTVGYSFLNLVQSVFVDGRAEPALTALYDRLTGERQDPVAITEAAKREALTLFDAELDRLTALLVEVVRSDRGAATSDDGSEDDATLVDRARQVLTELVVAFPVYRTYVVPERDEIVDEDHEVLDRALATARVHVGADPLLDVLDDVLRLRRRDGASSAQLVHRFQQLTGPVMAKGLEDTTFYRYLRFVAANEVGGHPAHLGASVDDLHLANQARQQQRPTTMLTTSTHDTKRAEDVRARLVGISDVPDLWVRTVQRLERVSAHHRGSRGPSPAHRYLLWQTLVGTWPISADRLVDYAVKAAREGKQATSWLEPDVSYERDLERFARAVTTDPHIADVLAPLLDVLVRSGRVNSIAMALLRLTSPGVPDTYQGTEVWDLSLVDPDNRRPVDHAANQHLLAWLDGDPRPTPDEVLGRSDEGAPKLLTVATALRARRERASSFGPHGSYRPLVASGPRAAHVVSHLRGDDVAVVVPRRVASLGPAFGRWQWHDTTLALPPGRWRDRITRDVVDGGTAVDVADLLRTFPVALLEREGTS